MEKPFRAVAEFGGRVSSTAVEVPQPSAGLSQIERVTNIFFAPTKTFEDIKRSASWWMPWLLMSIVSYGLVFAWQQKIGFEKLADNQLQIRLASSRSAQEAWDKTPPEQQEKQKSIGLAFTKGISYVIPIFTVLMAAIISGVLLGVFNFGFGAKTKFKEVMAITQYSFLPGIISTILAIVTVYLADPDGYDMRMPVASNPGAFINNIQHPALWTLMTAFDIFIVWYIFLMATGFSTITNNKVKRGTAFATIFGIFFVLKLIGAGFAAM
jgi:Yip1 domain